MTKRPARRPGDHFANHSETLAVQAQPPIACYVGADGLVMIVQEPDKSSEDVIITVLPELLPHLINRLHALLPAAKR